MKTKIGLSVGLVGMGVYLLGLFGGFTVLFLVAGYILVAEENAWLRVTAAKACILAVLFSLANVLIGLIPDLLGILTSTLAVFEVPFRLYWVNNLFSAIHGVVNVVKILLFLLLAFKALTMENVVLGPLDAFLKNHMPEANDAEEMEKAEAAAAAKQAAVEEPAVVEMPEIKIK